jgi:hypothetical protein
MECQKLDTLVNDALNVLGSLPVGTICAFAARSIKLPVKDLDKEGYNVSKPAVICAENGLGRLLTWYTDEYDIELAHVFYDQNESFIKSIRTRWHQHEAQIAQNRRGKRPRMLGASQM